jgi:virulence factor Mce-like protein
MKRLLALGGAVALALAVALVAFGAGGDDQRPTYDIELDNAFGLVPGSDLKVAGVRAGSITGLRLDRHTKRAIVGIRIDKTGFGSLRSDVRCTVRPQSLLGEYYIDCLPGRARRELPHGATIPVERTASTVPPDLVLNVMRLPYRERLRLIVSELGAGVAAEGPRLNAAIRRAVPAIGQTQRVLGTLGAQDRALRELLRDADTVTTALAGNRQDVGRWVREARDTAVAAARRRGALAEGLHRLPAFLREVEPSMRSLGDLARAGAPSVRNLSAGAGQLATFLDRSTATAQAARPAVAALGEAARAGRPAVRSATPSVAELRRFATHLPEVARDIALVLESLDRRDQAIEAHPLSPGGQGYTALENVMNYVFNQVLAINIYDGENHILKGAAFVNDCSPYSETIAGKEKCRTWMGPTQPGVNAPDASRQAVGDSRARRRGRHPSAAAPVPLRAPTGLGALPAPAAAPDQPKPPAPAPSARPPLPVPVPDVPLPPLPGTPLPQDSSLLDYLLGS